MFIKRSQEIQCLVGEFGVTIKQEFKNYKKITKKLYLNDLKKV